jgi:hypothetical protein
MDSPCQKDKSSYPRLLNLPVELMEMIIGELLTTDVLSIRLTCRNLEQKTRDYCGRNVFANVRTDLSRGSLWDLAKIAEHVILSDYAKTMIIPQCSPERMLGRGHYWPRHNGLIGPSEGFETLKDILLNKLPNCRSFHIEANAWTDPPTDGNLVSTDVVNIVYKLVAEHGLQVQALVIDGTPPNKSSPGWLDSKCLDSFFFESQLFKEAWVHVKSIHLTMGISQSQIDWTIRTICYAKNLEKLSICGSRVPSQEEYFFERFKQVLQPSCLQQENISGQFKQIHQLPYLQELCLAQFHVQRDALLGLLQSLRDTLTRIEFSKIFIKNGDRFWIDTIKEMQNCHALKSFSFRRLHEKRPIPVPNRSSPLYPWLLAFPEISIESEIPGGGGFSKVELEYGRHDLPMQKSWVAYSGPNALSALKMLEKSAEYV